MSTFGVSQVDVAGLTRWLGRFCELVTRNKEELTRLDSAIGDADHGVNMERGAVVIRQVLDRHDIDSTGQLLNVVADAALEGVGGAAGPLYASLLFGAGAATGDHEMLDISQFAIAIEQGVAALAARGRAELQDKTMYDAAQPASAALTSAAVSGAKLDIGIEAARTAAARGRDATEPLQARKGRASYLGPRSMGHIDPGAASMAMLFDAMAAITGTATT